MFLLFNLIQPSHNWKQRYSLCSAHHSLRRDQQPNLRKQLKTGLRAPFEGTVCFVKISAKKKRHKCPESLFGQCPKRDGLRWDRMSNTYPYQLGHVNIGAQQPKSRTDEIRKVIGKIRKVEPNSESSSGKFGKSSQIRKVSKMRPKKKKKRSSLL